MAGTPAAEPPEHWHGISWTIRVGLEEPVQQIRYAGGLSGDCPVSLLCYSPKL